MDPINALRSFVRACVGLPDNAGMSPVIDRLAFYRAQVVSASSDGKTLDVQPEDKRVSPHQQVPIRVGIPGAVAVVTPGAVVMLGWDGGNPKLPYCVPHWESGATVTKLTLNAQALELAGNGHPLPLFDTFMTDLAAWIGAVNTLIGTLVPITGATGGPAYATAIALPTSLVVKMAVLTNYQSTKVKNG